MTLPDLRGAKKYTVEELKSKGCQPCIWVGHYQGTNCEDWRCPQCGKEYVCETKAYCPDCFESDEDIGKRLEEKEKELERMKNSIPSIEGDIAVLKKLLSR